MTALLLRRFVRGAQRGRRRRTPGQSRTMLLTLHHNERDDLDCLESVSKLIAGALENQVSGLWVIHVDNWFGDGWLGFCGKAVGAVGVHRHFPADPLVYPPFHPNRILSEQQFAVSHNGTFDPVEVDEQTVHRRQPSQRNLRRTIAVPGLYVWYSSRTNHADQGAVMAYLVAENRHVAWYIAFRKDREWRIGRTIGISRARCLSLIELGTPGDS